MASEKSFSAKNPRRSEETILDVKTSNRHSLNRQNSNLKYLATHDSEHSSELPAALSFESSDDDWDIILDQSLKIPSYSSVVASYPPPVIFGSSSSLLLGEGNVPEMDEYFGLEDKFLESLDLENNSKKSDKRIRVKGVEMKKVGDAPLLRKQQPKFISWADDHLSNDDNSLCNELSKLNVNSAANIDGFITASDSSLATASTSSNARVIRRLVVSGLGGINRIIAENKAATLMSKTNVFRNTDVKLMASRVYSDSKKIPPSPTSSSSSSSSSSSTPSQPHHIHTENRNNRDKEYSNNATVRRRNSLIGVNSSDNSNNNSKDDIDGKWKHDKFEELEAEYETYKNEHHQSLDNNRNCKKKEKPQNSKHSYKEKSCSEEKKSTFLSSPSFSRKIEEIKAEKKLEKRNINNERRFKNDRNIETTFDKTEKEEYNQFPSVETKEIVTPPKPTANAAQIPFYSTPAPATTHLQYQQQQHPMQQQPQIYLSSPPSIYSQSVPQFALQPQMLNTTAAYDSSYSTGLSHQYISPSGIYSHPSSAHSPPHHHHLSAATEPVVALPGGILSYGGYCWAPIGHQWFVSPQTTATTVGTDAMAMHSLEAISNPIFQINSAPPSINPASLHSPSSLSSSISPSSASSSSSSSFTYSGLQQSSSLSLSGQKAPSSFAPLARTPLIPLPPKKSTTLR